MAGGATTAAPVSIRDEEAFRAWVESGAAPFDRMTPGGRLRVARSVKFAHGSVAGVSTGDLLGELTVDEAAVVLEAIGLDAQFGAGALSAAEAMRKRARVVPPISAGSIEARVNDVLLAALAGDDAVVGAAYVDAFGEAAFAADLEAAGPHELELLGRATSMAAFGARDPRWTARAVAVFERLAAMGQATRGEAASALSLLARLDRLEDAVAFSHRHRALGLRPLPDIVDAADRDPSRPAWLVAGPALLRENATLDGLRIVVASATGCGFSRAAVAAIPADPVLGPIFARHGLWVAAPSQFGALASLRDWNAKHPSAPLRIATGLDRWPVSDIDVTPTFYLLRDGRPVGTPFRRWMPDGSDRDALLAWWRSEAGSKPDPAR